MALPTIRRGDKGDAVRYAQERLNTKGFIVHVDGDFGPATYNAVRQFQASENLQVDGIVGPQTWARLQVEAVAPEPSDLIQEQRAWLLDQIPPGLLPVVHAALVEACEALGLKEIPDGSNAGPEIARYVDGYNEYWKTGTTTRYPWCAMYVATCIAVAYGLAPNPTWGAWKGHPFYVDAKGGGAFRGSSMDIEDWAKAAGVWTEASPQAVAPAGAVFTMARGTSGSDASSSTKAGHTGFIVCDNNDETVYTAEGNVSNKVGSHKRHKGDLRGWAAWWKA